MPNDDAWGASSRLLRPPLLAGTTGASRSAAGVISEMTLPAMPSVIGGGGSSPVPVLIAAESAPKCCCDRGRDASPDAATESSSTSLASARYSMPGGWGDGKDATASIPPPVPGAAALSSGME